MVFSISAAITIYLMYKYGIHHIYTLSLAELTVLIAFKDNSISAIRALTLTVVLGIEIIDLYREVPYKDFVVMFLIGLFMLIGIKESYDKLRK